MEKKFVQKLMIYGILLMLFGVNSVAGVGTSIGYSHVQINETTSSSSTTTDWWPMYRHDSGNTGFSLSTAPMRWDEYWKYDTNSYIEGSSPTIVNGKLYIGTSGYYNKSSDTVIPPSLLHHQRAGMELLCLDAEDGSVLWEHPSGVIISSPAVYSEKVYCSYIIDEYHGGISCLNADSGNLIWEKTIQYFVTSPIIAQGNVYIASSGVYYGAAIINCYNETTGNPVWSYTLPYDYYISCSPAVLNGKLYCVHDSSTGSVVSCLNAATGQLNWDQQLTTDTSLFTFSIAACDTIVVVAGATPSGTYGMVYGLDTTTGGVIWDYQTGEWYTQWPDIMPSFSIAYNRVYFIAMLLTQDSTVYCLDLATGNELWTMENGDLAASSPAIADGKMYYTTIGGLLYCLNTTDGGFIWSSSFKGGTSSPSIANETIFVADITGAIFAYGAPRDPANPTIDGPANGKIKKMVNYTFSTTDPNGKDVYYYVNWGDGQSENWVGPYGSGDPVVIGHVWSKKGTYSIQAKAKNIHGFESGWTTLSVKMPCSFTQLWVPFWERLLAQFPHAFPLLRHLLGSYQ
jgi:outer membrane protein assembly factor BamB